MAAAAALLLVLGGVATWVVTRGASTATTATTGAVSVPAMDERTVAVPMYVPERMALTEAGTNDVAGVIGTEGKAADVAVASWQRSDATLEVSSSSGDQVLVFTGDTEIELRTGALARYTEETDGAIVIAWRQPDGGPVVGIRATGLDLDDVVAVANSMWFVTPAMWMDLTDRAGFASSEEAAAGYDLWTPPSDVDLDESAVRIVGDLQSGLWLSFPGGVGHFFDRSTIDRDWCSAMSMPRPPEPETWPVVLVTFDPSVTGFMVPDETGTVRRVDADRHPGLPQMRFAAAVASGLSFGGPNVPCVRGDR